MTMNDQISSDDATRNCVETYYELRVQEAFKKALEESEHGGRVELTVILQETKLVGLELKWKWR